MAARKLADPGPILAENTLRDIQGDMPSVPGRGRVASAEGQVAKVRVGQLVFQAAWHAPAQVVAAEDQP